MDKVSLGRKGCGDKEDQSQEFRSTTENSYSSLVLSWLDQNYEQKEGSCLPRCMLYEHYLEFCRSSGCVSIGAAIFGKLIHTKFRSLTTRRLGTRGQSKYHYYGLALKENSTSIPRSNLKLTRFSAFSDSQQCEQTKKQQKHASISILEGFPTIVKTKAGDGMAQKNFSKIESFLVMYKAHCQRVLEAVVAANFDDVKSFILHFWSGMPSHVTAVLKMNEIEDLISACDTVFYKNLIDIILPTSVQDLPDSYRSEITNFTKSFLPWLDICMMNVPSNLVAAKMNVARTYIKIIQRELSFLSFAQPVLTILSNRDLTNEISKDIEKIDVLEVLGISPLDQRMQSCTKIPLLVNLQSFLTEVVHLLTRQASLGVFLGLLDKLAHDTLIKSAKVADGRSKMTNSSFILQLSLVLSKLMQDLTLRSAKTFGSIHILCSMFMEYLFLAIESMTIKDEERSIWEKIKKFSSDCSEEASSAKAMKRKPNGQLGADPVSKKQCQAGDQQNHSLQHQEIVKTPVTLSFPTPKRPLNNASNGSSMPVLCNQKSGNENPYLTARQARDAAALLQEMPSLQDMVASYGWVDFQGIGEDFQSDNEHRVNGIQNFCSFTERGMEPVLQKIY
ncbi:DNA-binding protein RFX6-like [Rhopilema esculentum]|uniref:DNA-binding protein RFX6-like n=1 Tax=Rhopilema esculentum TaxID=499914 RepID=UPI0031E1E6B2